MGLTLIDIGDKISRVYEEVKSTSFREKTSEEKINDLLDTILLFKTYLRKRILVLNRITEKMEALTWYTNVSNDNLKSLNELIASARDLHSVLIRKYVGFNSQIIRRKNIATEEMLVFKNSVDDFKETYEDLESIFFFLPNNSEFIEITKQFSKL